MENQRFSTLEYRKLPHQPGVYKFFNSDQKIIYVGKAKNLNKRVASYFSKSSGVSRKTQKLVKEINFIEFVIVNSEFDALLLENSLIKENQPKYNILLKDDKTFPSICITRERFPRIYSTRQIVPSKGEYFGPFTSVKAMNSVLELVQKLFTIRTCNFALTEKNIAANRFKVCLEYHIGNCLGPCEGLQSESDYDNDIASVRHILQGHLGVVRNELKQNMVTASEQLDYESALRFKNKIELLEKFHTKSLIVNPKIGNLDVLAVISHEDRYFINYLQVTQGAIKLSETIETSRKIEETDEEVIQTLAFSLHKRFNSISTEMICNIEFPAWEEMSVIVPKIGDKKKLIDLSLKNALYFKRETQQRKEQLQESKTSVLKQLQEDLGLKALPVHIECFDNSNIQGTNPVSSMVCFKNGKPAKSEYRKFKIKTVIGPDDFASMKEVVGRRYKRLYQEELPLPDLIVIDGGKGQLSSACEALKEVGVYGQIPIIGIAKRLEEIYFPEDSIPVHISKKSPALKLLQHLRDEAHRFAINFHRDQRSKNAFKTELEDIVGIGPKSRQQLMEQFKTITRIKQADQEQLSTILGQQKGALVFDFFQKKRD